jgi:hypothetical protein
MTGMRNVVMVSVVVAACGVITGGHARSVSLPCGTHDIVVRLAEGGLIARGRLAVP